MPHTRRDFLQMLGAGAPLAALPVAGYLSSPANSDPHDAALYTAAAFQLASNELPGAFKLVSATTTQIVVTPDPYDAIEGRGWIIIEPFTGNCEIRRVGTVSGTTIGFAPNLVYAHPVDVPVLFTDNLVITPELFGANSGSADDHTALTRAIAQAKLITPADSGPTPKTGAVVYLIGEYKISQPLVLPRTNAYTTSQPTNVVQLKGYNIRSSRLIGTDAFPENRALIEWESRVSRVWMQSISNLTLVLPDVQGCMAIHYKLTQSYQYLNSGQQDQNNNPIPALLDERMGDFELSDVLIEANNSFHPYAIYLEGNVINLKMVNVTLDPTLGTAGLGKQTILIKTDYALLKALVASTEGYISSDGNGLSAPYFQNITLGARRGGRVAFCDMRMVRGTATHIYDGVGSSGAPFIRLRNSYFPTFNDVFCEGGIAYPAQYYITNSEGGTVNTYTIGTPIRTNAEQSFPYGNGIVLEDNTNGWEFRNRVLERHKPPFSNYGTRALKIISKNEAQNIRESKRNIFRAFHVTGVSANEIEIPALASECNYVEAVNLSYGVVDAFGRLNGNLPVEALSVGGGTLIQRVVRATISWSPSPTSIPDGAFVSRDFTSADHASLADAARGDVVLLSFTLTLQAGVHLFGTVVDVGTVRVTLHNHSGGARLLTATGTLGIVLMKF
jgi:hypothetical protein